MVGALTSTAVLGVESYKLHVHPHYVETQVFREHIRRVRLARRFG